MNIQIDPDRLTAHGSKGMVAASQSLAVDAGLDILERGGMPRILQWRLPLP